MKEQLHYVALQQKLDIYPPIYWKYFVVKYHGILFEMQANYGVFASQRLNLPNSSAEASGVEKTVRECKEPIGSETQTCNIEKSDLSGLD